MTIQSQIITFPSGKETLAAYLARPDRCDRILHVGRVCDCLGLHN
jgi:hypothetical protein